MFGIGMSEMLLICALALIVVGPDKLPELARSIAKGVMELKKVASGLKESLNEEIAPALDLVKPELQEASKALHENLEHQKRITSSQTETTETSEPESQGDSQAPHNIEEPEMIAETEGGVNDQTTVPSISTDDLIARAQQSKSNGQEEK